MENSYLTLQFNEDGNKIKVKSGEIGAVINNYDIVEDFGEDNICKKVSEEYQKWLNEGECVNDETERDINKVVDKYISEIDSNYGKYSFSTDFTFYNDDVKVFAKDLKTYDGRTL